MKLIFLFKTINLQVEGEPKSLQITSSSKAHCRQ